MSKLPLPVSVAELESRYQNKTIAFETALTEQRPHGEINKLYQELKIIQQEINLAQLEEELRKNSGD
jgi:hypothetical protein